MSTCENSPLARGLNNNVVFIEFAIKGFGLAVALKEKLGKVLGG